MYYLTTVVPQLDYVNRKTWLELEKYTSLLAADSRVFVIRGPMYQAKNGASLVNALLMGPGLIPVPTDFFQILVVQGRSALQVEAHIIPNTYVPFTTSDLPKFKVSVGDISKATGLTFDAKLSPAAN
jgi:DNA/RNA endonuclease G (NUC1)